jgi:phosphatidylglycerophosphate synthase
MTLVARAAALAARAGFSPVLVHGPYPATDEPRLLESAGADVTLDRESATPLAAAPGSGGVVFVAPDVLAGPEVFDAFAAHAANPAARPLAAARDGAVLAIYLPEVTDHARHATSIDDIVAGLEATGPLEHLSGPRMFLEPISDGDDAMAVARRYIRHLNGPGEAYFTKRIRRYSVPLSARLVELGVHPTSVTLGGLVLAILSAIALARGEYMAGIAGAVAYYASMVLDCSDGEVAGLSVRDSAFGAWLETVVDYSTYGLVLTALFVASQSGEHAELYRTLTVIAAVASVLVIGVASYLRRRVAGSDPGRFDDASAAALAEAGPLHRFARWGRQWIKRSTMAHLLVALALVGRLEALILLWAFGATLAALVIVAVEPFVVRRVRVAAPPAAGTSLAARRGGPRASL